MSGATKDIGPRENPYDDEFSWWVDDGELVVRGHPVEVSCLSCGEEMRATDVIDGHAAVISCNNCEREHEHWIDGDTFTYELSLEVCVTGLSPELWGSYVEGFECDIEETEDGCHLSADLGDDVYEFELRMPTVEGGQ
ncbi:hypothetical protein [Haloprofundus sp. MHR1]|uniref:hypothetical protein n=1 Tax=Haloprofundus sp. MHR1 TaxID=2572921 RepID=UPI0010BF38FC|nr:hypothetical protein [Haloprofundus sp. MHR1]QCJ47218.1 hypothetical protein FCF25_08845 [Haloprofundus sp. MHR1]